MDFLWSLFSPKSRHRHFARLDQQGICLCFKHCAVPPEWHRLGGNLRAETVLAPSAVACQCPRQPSPACDYRPTIAQLLTERRIKVIFSGSILRVSSL
jgi:hypothetical protein